MSMHTSKKHNGSDPIRPYAKLKREHHGRTPGRSCCRKQNLKRFMHYLRLGLPKELLQLLIDHLVNLLGQRFGFIDR